MPASEKSVRLLAGVYLIAVTLVAAVFIVFGLLLSWIPWLPDSVERTYAGYLVRFLDAVLRPFDVFSPVRTKDAH